jgi:hypothetical protein
VQVGLDISGIHRADKVTGKHKARIQPDVVGRRAGDRESQKTCRLSRSVNNGKVAGSRYEDTEPLEVKESWVQALSLQKDSRLFYLWHHLICGGRRQFRSGRASYLSFRSPYCGSWVFTSELVEMEVEDEGKNRD